ncbi:MAG: ParA family protein [Gammaproteobacteria bacterium]|nr:ParA family protein [Gammaproteobacteria bacterium]
MRILAILNQKGGVGKTTTTANLAHALVLAGKRVTTIDLDPQGHLSATFGIFDERGLGIDEVLLGDVCIADVVQQVREGLYLIPAGHRLGKMEMLTQGGASRGTRLRTALTGQFEDQDFILMDCPPASGILVMNALAVADEVIVPVAGDYLGLRGLGYLMKTLKSIEQGLQKKLEKWIVVTRFHARRRLPREVVGKLLDYFPGQVLSTPIRETTALAESPGFGMTIFEYNDGSNGALDYRSLAMDYLNGRTM